MTFEIETSDVADADIQAAFLRLSAWDPDFAGKWLEGLLRAIENLSQWPSRYARVAESEILRQDVRRMLYKNGRTVYRVLFVLLDADGDGEQDTVRVLRVLHGAQRPLNTDDDND